MATMTTTVRPAAQMVNSGSLVLKRFKETRLEYADCFGEEAFHVAALVGRIIGWRVTGDLANTATKILDTLSKLIAENRADLLRTCPKSAPGTFHLPSYSLEPFLLGKDKAHATPHVAVITRVEWLDKCLRRIITKSKILTLHPHWACIRLPFNVTPTSPVALFPTGPEAAAAMWLQDIHRFEIYVPGKTVPKYLSGTAIEIWRDGSYMNKATVGGTLSVGSQNYALTVAHVFYHYQTQGMESFEFDESELGCLETDEIVADEMGSIYPDDDGSMSSSIQWPPEIPQIESPPSPLKSTVSPGSLSWTEDKILIGHLAYISNKTGATTALLDWALIQITHPEIPITNPRLPTSIESRQSITQNRVNILTPSREVSGSVVSTAIFCVPIFDEPQAVLVIDAGSTQLGESGSWAFHSSDGQPFGMLIGKSSPPLNESYILTMSDIMKNIEEQTGLVADVPIQRDINSQEQLNFIYPQGERRGDSKDGEENKHRIRDIKAVEQVRSSTEVEMVKSSPGFMSPDLMRAMGPTLFQPEPLSSAISLIPGFTVGLQKLIQEENKIMLREMRESLIQEALQVYHMEKQEDNLLRSPSSPGGTKHASPSQYPQRHSPTLHPFDLPFKEIISETSSEPPASSIRFNDGAQNSPEASQGNSLQGKITSNQSRVEPVEPSVIDEKWGLLFDDDGHPTRRLLQILQGLADYIATEFLPRNSIVVTPDKLAAFYSYHRLEKEKYPFSVLFRNWTADFNERLADLYQDLDCEYHLVQTSTRSRPTIPCLTLGGFAQWVITNIQAYPDEESKRLENIVSALPIEVESPLDGKSERLPKRISRHLLPAKFNKRSRALLDEAMKDFMEDPMIPPPARPSPTIPLPTRPVPIISSLSSEATHESRSRETQPSSTRSPRYTPPVSDDSPEGQAAATKVRRTGLVTFPEPPTYTGTRSLSRP